MRTNAVFKHLTGVRIAGNDREGRSIGTQTCQEEMNGWGYRNRKVKTTQASK